MALFDFVCTSCKAVSEQLVRKGETPTLCPECGADDKPLEKKIEIPRTSFMLKGSGWSSDGYSAR